MTTQTDLALPIAAAGEGKEGVRSCKPGDGVGQLFRPLQSLFRRASGYAIDLDNNCVLQAVTRRYGTGSEHWNARSGAGDYSEEAAEVLGQSVRVRKSPPMRVQRHGSFCPVRSVR